MNYERALKRLKTLLAQNALDQAVEDATEDVLLAAAEEAAAAVAAADSNADADVVPDSDLRVPNSDSSGAISEVVLQDRAPRGLTAAIAITQLTKRAVSPVESGIHHKYKVSALSIPSALGSPRGETPSEWETVHTRTMTKKVGSADVERYLREMWERVTDESGRVRVRDRLHMSIESGVLDPDARERLLKMTA